MNNEEFIAKLAEIFAFLKARGVDIHAFAQTLSREIQTFGNS